MDSFMSDVGKKAETKLKRLLKFSPVIEHARSKV